MAVPVAQTSRVPRGSGRPFLSVPMAAAATRLASVTAGSSARTVLPKGPACNFTPFANLPNGKDRTFAVLWTWGKSLFCLLTSYETLTIVLLFWSSGSLGDMETGMPAAEHAAGKGDRARTAARTGPGLCTGFPVFPQPRPARLSVLTRLLKDSECL